VKRFFHFKDRLEIEIEAEADSKMVARGRKQKASLL
jgi:hypothetical protein